MAEKMTRKELRAPDAFQKAGVGAWSWAQERQKLVFIAIGAVLVVGTGVALSSYLEQRAEARAAQAYGAALAVLERPVQEAAAEPAGGDEAPFSSPSERDEAVVEAMGQVRAEHGRTRAAASAALVQGHAELRLGRPDAARESFDAFLEGALPDDVLRASALEGTGYAHERQGALDEALAAFEKMAAEEASGFLAGMGLFHQGRLLIAQEKSADAARVLAQLTELHPGTPAARMAEERLARLASQGVEVPEAAEADATGGAAHSN